MKGFRKGFLLTLLTLLCLSMGMFVACKGKNKVTISFELNGAEAQSFEPMEVIAGEDMVLRIPTRDGYDFTGWYDNAELKGTALMGGTVTAPNQDTTYYASWAQRFKATLDSGEGAFADGEKVKEIYIAKGKKLLDVLSEYTPTFNSLQLGAWFSANNQVGEDSVMPGRDARFTAKYSVGYSVEIYKQASSSVYEHDAGSDYDDIGFYGDDLTITPPTFEGFDFFRNHPEGVPTLKLGENASANVFKLYYNKLAHTIIYDVNAPENATYTGYMADQKILHGEEGKALECTYAIHSYRFAGWARSSSADVEFHPGDTLPEGSYTLYAVWDAGYSDVFGGTDCIFFPHTGKDGTAILLRGNVEIIGKTHRLEGEQYVEDQNGMFVIFNDNLIAKLVDSDPKGFSFLDKEMKGDYNFYNPYYIKTSPAVVADDTILTLDGFDGAVLTNSENIVDYTISLDEESGNYKLTGERGTFYAVLGKEGEKKVFTFVGSEKGSYDQFVRVNATGYAPGDYTLSLDGLGNASWSMSVTGTGIRGRYEEPTLINGYQFVTVHLDDGRELKFSFLEFESLTAVELNDGMEGTYTLKDGEGNVVEGTTLFLDGFGGFTGTTIFDGKQVFYMLEDTIFGKVVSIIDTTTVTARYKLDGEYFTELTDNYTIYQYLYSPDGLINDLGNIYLVIYEKKENEDVQKAAVYKGSNGASTKIYEGTVTLDEKLKPLSVFKANDEYKVDSDFPYNEFKFYGSDRFAAGPLFYIYLEEVTEEGGNYLPMKVRETNQNLIVYTGLNTSAGYGLEGLGSFLVDENGTYVEGSLDTILLDTASMNDCKKFFNVDNYYSFTYYNDQNALAKRYFEVYQIGEEAATATYEVAEVRDEPMALAICYGEMPQGTEYPFAMEMSLYLNGKGEARYLTETAEGSVFVKGTYVSMGLVNEMRAFRITFDDPNVPSMNGQEVEFAVSALDPLYYHVHNKIMEGTNVIEGNSYVELNGWGTHAVYVDNFGHRYEGYYTFYAGQTGILMYSDMRTGVTQVYIRDGKFINTPPEVSGAQQGWRVVDQNFKEYLDPNSTAIFDGEGGVTIEDMHDYMNWLINGGDSNIYGLKRTIYGRGFYTAVSEFEYDLEVGFYGEDGKITTERWRAKLADGCCIRMGEGAVGSYIQESDKAVLYLDGYGTGFYVDGRGNREDGNYLFVDEDNGIGMFLGESVSYMVNYGGEGANRSFRILNDPSKFKTFYADDLSSIEFCDMLRVDGQNIGLWYFDNDEFVFYEFTENGFERTQTYHYEYGDTYHDQAYDRDKTYTVWTPKQLDLTGEIVFRAMEERGEENSTIGQVSLSFTPNGNTSIDAPAVLKFRDFREGAEEKSYSGFYTVKMVEKETIVGAGEQLNGTYHLFLCYGDMEFPLSVSMEDGSFRLWANIDLDGRGNDVNVLTGNSTVPFADVNFGKGYTLGVINWTLSDWDIQNDTLVGGYAKAVDKNGDLIFFEVLWSDYKGHNEKCIGVSEEAIGNLNIYEIFTKNLKGDGVTVVLLETYELSNMAAFYFVLYAACEWYEVPHVYLPTSKTENAETEYYKVYQERVISTSKGFSVGSVAYQHVYKAENHSDDASEADDGQAPDGFESISTGFIAYMMSVDMILVDSLGGISAGSRVLALTPEHVDKDVWDYDKMTVWFGVDKHLAAVSPDDNNVNNFKGVSYDIIFLTNEYKNKTNAGMSGDDRTVIDGWLVYYYIADPTTNVDIPYSYRYGYKDNGKERIARITCQDKVTMFDLYFGGTITNPTVSYELYIPPKEDEEDKDDGTDQSEGEGKEEESSGS